MNVASLDTNIVLRMILNDVPDQASKAASYVSRTPSYVTDVVLSESVLVLEKVYKLERRLIRDFLLNLLQIKTVIFNETLIERTFDKYVAQRSLSFVDCYSIEEARLSGNQVITFDRAILRKSPRISKEPS